MVDSTVMQAGRYKAYPEYKDISLGWLNSLPKHWEIKKLKYIGDSIIGLTYSPDDVVDFDSESATLVLRSSNVQNKQLSFDDNVYVNKTIPTKLKTQLDDILICARNGSRALIGKNTLIDQSSVGLSFGAFMMIFRSPYNKYLSNVFNSAIFDYQSGTFLTTTINQLTSSNLNSFEVPFPPFNEQEKIASFLDHETAKIDTLIEKQQRLIELLTEKRQAVISHAVTKGLNPDVPMKDSGVEWLGKVPEHWEVSSLRWFIDIASGKGLSSEELNKEKSESHPIPAVGGNGVMGFTNKVNTKNKALAIGRVGALCGNVHLIDYNAWITDNALKISRWRGFSQEYLAKLLEEANLNELASKTAQPLITGEQVKSLIIVIPPLSEQKEIASFIDKMHVQFNLLTQKAQQAIQLMQERRTALISAAVTGKIDVRDWVVPVASEVYS